MRRESRGRQLLLMAFVSTMSYVRHRIESSRGLYLEVRKEVSLECVWTTSTRAKFIVAAQWNGIRLKYGDRTTIIRPSDHPGKGGSYVAVLVLDAPPPRHGMQREE